MQITERLEGPHLILSLVGRLDHAGAQIFQKTATDHIAAGARSLIVDFGGIDFVASMGIRALIVPAQAVGQEGGKLVITGLSPSVRELFELTGLHQMFTVYDSIDDALAAS